MSDLHSGMKIRSGGATQAEVEKMLKQADANNDGEITQPELEALANQGRATGFSDESSFQLFNAGLDAAAFAEIKSREPGQQFTPEYLDTQMKPFLAKNWGTYGKQAADLIVPQASRELTQDAARGLGKKSDALQRNAIEQVMGQGVEVVDNGNGRVDPDDTVLKPNAKGGYDHEPLGQKSADAINDVAGLRRGMKLIEQPNGPWFPNSGGPDWATRDGGNARAGWMNGGDPNGPWGMQQIPAGQPGAGYNEFKLDTSRMTASQALDDIAKNPKNYCMDCAMGKQVLQYARAREVLGDEKFNQLAAKHGMVIGHSDAVLRSGLLKKMTAVAEGASVNMPLDEYKAGWGGYAKVLSVGNPDVKKELDAMGWSGEHFTVGLDENGKKVVTAHPFGTVPLEKFDGMLRDRLVADSGGRIKREDILIEYRPPIDPQPTWARENL